MAVASNGQIGRASQTLTDAVISGSPTAAGSTWANLGTVSTVDINGGTVDGVVVGGATPADGTFLNVDAGTSGTAGSMDVFPATALKGKTQIVAQDNAGNTVTTISTAAQAAARTYTVADAGASASFVMTEGAQTVNGVKTFGNGVALGAGATFDADSGTATATAGAATLNKMAGVITSESLTTAAGAAYTLTLTNSVVAAGDIVLASLDNGTNTTDALTLRRVTAGAGQVVFVVNNTATVSALNGTIRVSFLVVKA